MPKTRKTIEKRIMMGFTLGQWNYFEKQRELDDMRSIRDWFIHKLYQPERNIRKLKEEEKKSVEEGVKTELEIKCEWWNKLEDENPEKWEGDNWKLHPEVLKDTHNERFTEPGDLDHFLGLRKLKRPLTLQARAFEFKKNNEGKNKGKK